MVQLNWSSELDTEFDTFTQTRKKFLDIINEVNNAMDLGDTGAMLVEIQIDENMKGSKRFFSTEKNIMEKNHFPHMEQHFNEHEDFTNKMLQLKDDFSNNQEETIPHIAKALDDLWNSHILGTDQKLIDWLKKNNLNDELTF